LCCVRLRVRGRVHGDRGSVEAARCAMRSGSDAAQANDDQAKRRKLADTFDPDDFAPGAIYRLTMHNFMTYSHAELSPPGPRLNCIVGPNGTGKSSVVNALAIVLGGSLRLTERGDRASDAIKHGCDKGYVEIELRDGNGPGQNLIIRADLDLETNHTKYSIDGKKTTKTEVKDRVKKLGIMIDNMLQFLPQDKVIEFTKLNPKELLASTMKAVMPDEHTEHEELIQLAARVGEADKVRKGKEKKLNGLREDVEKLELDVQRHAEYERNVEKRNNLEGKSAWIKVLSKNAEVKDTSAKLKEAKKELAREEAARDAARAPLEAAKGAKRRANDAHNKAIDAARDAERKAIALRAEIETKHQETVDALDAERTKLEKALDDQQSRVRTAKQQLERARAELERVPDDAELGPQRDAATKKIKEHSDERARLEGDFDAARTAKRLAESKHDSAMRQLEQLQDSEKAKAFALERRHPDSFKVRQWVAQNAQSFEGEVVGPIGLLIDVVDEDHGRYVEKAVSDGIFGGFIVFNPHDRDVLTSAIRANK